MNYKRVLGWWANCGSVHRENRRLNAVKVIVWNDIESLLRHLNAEMTEG